MRSHVGANRFPGLQGTKDYLIMFQRVKIHLLSSCFLLNLVAGDGHINKIVCEEKKKLL